MSIPVIDLQPFLQARDPQTVEQIDRACREVGCLYLTHFGMDDRLIQQTFAEAGRLFQLPAAVKAQLAWTDAHSNQGYVGLGREQLDPNQPGDLKEAFNIGDRTAALLAPHLPAPSQPTIAAFWDGCVGVLDALLRAIAAALQLPDSFFTARHQRQAHMLRLLHYPPLHEPQQPRQSRAAAHSDYGTLTLLFQDAIDGLEVQTRAGEWIAAPPIPGTVLINIGDLMERWTNHRYRSTPHRVVLSPAQPLRSRQSIAFFCHPDAEVEVACLGDEPPRYPPIAAGEYLLSRLQETY